MPNNQLTNPGDRVIPASDNKQLMEPLSTTDTELLVLILLELRQFTARSEKCAAIEMRTIRIDRQ